MQQFNTLPTHSKGHILYLVCCSGITPFHFTASDLSISDHLLVSFCARLAVFKVNPCRPITFRNIKNIDVPSLADELAIFSSKSDFSTVDELVSYYNDGLTTILDDFAPVKIRTVSFVHSAPWFTPELRELKTKGRRLERCTLGLALLFIKICMLNIFKTTKMHCSKPDLFIIPT